MEKNFDSNITLLHKMIAEQRNWKKMVVATPPIKFNDGPEITGVVTEKGGKKDFTMKYIVENSGQYSLLDYDGVDDNMKQFVNSQIKDMYQWHEFHILLHGNMYHWHE